MTGDFTRRQALGAIGAGVAAAVAGRSAHAQSLPAGTIRILVGYPAGGGTDVMARVVADKLKDRLGSTVIVENRPGVSGALAGAVLRDAPADGSVIMYAPSTATTDAKVTKKNLPFDLERDLAPVTLAGTVCSVFAVSPTIGVRTLAEYVDWLRKNPRKASFGSSAIGSAGHFFGMNVGHAIGIPLEAVPYKGAGPIVSDLAAGHATAGCGGLTDYLTHHRADKLRILAISAPKRATMAPDLPTIAELGYPKISSESFYGFYAPGRASPAIVDVWNRELRAVLETPEMRQRLLGLGLEPQTSTPAEFVERQARQIVAFTAAMKNAGYEPE